MGSGGYGGQDPYHWVRQKMGATYGREKAEEWYKQGSITESEYKQMLETSDTNEQIADYYLGNSSSSTSNVSSTVEGTAGETKKTSTGVSSTTAKAATSTKTSTSSKGMAGSILHAKGETEDTASGVLEGTGSSATSKKSKTLG